MSKQQTVLEALRERGVSRRTFLKFCAVTASSLALSAREAAVFAQAVGAAPRPAVIWLSFQQCTGCSESLLRTFNPTIETLLLDVISLDYQETLQVAAGNQAEDARKASMAANAGSYVLVVDGSIPTGEKEWWSTVAGHSNLASLREAVENAGLVVAIGTCATFGGIPAAHPNPSSATGVGDLMAAGLIPTKTLVNLSGCPPVPEAIAGTIALYLSLAGQGRLGELPSLLDSQKRPLPYYGKTVHDCCPRLEHFNAGRFAQSFGDDGAKQGWCLYMLGCKGPETFNACSTVKWNNATSFPMHTGHGCIGCSEPRFWDRGRDPATGEFTTSFYGADAGGPPADPTGCN